MELNNEKNFGAAHPPPYTAPGHPQQQPQIQITHRVITNPYAVPGPPYCQPHMQAPGHVIAAPAVVHTNAPIILPSLVVGQQVGSKPGPHTCRSCNTQIVTRVEQKTTIKTHLFAALMCLLGCWCCVCIPYCVDSCKNADHYCPECNAYIGSYVW